jgi:predicted RNA-binding Zn ribbon-like protein
MKQMTVAMLKLFGDHAALDFTNTVDSRGERFGPDVLQSYDDLLDWGMRLSVLDQAEAEVLRDLPAERGKVALSRAKVLREALYRVFATRPSADSSDLDLLQREVREAQEARVLLRDADGYAWRWRPDDPDTVTHRIAAMAADLLTSSALDRVRVCPGANCAWLFLDNSRAGRRLWCSEETCGTRNRVRRWRAHRGKDAR